MERQDSERFDLCEFTGIVDQSGSVCGSNCGGGTLEAETVGGEIGREDGGNDGSGRGEYWVVRREGGD